MAGISDTIPAYYERNIQPNAPVTGAAATSLTRATTTLAYRFAGNSRAVHYGDPAAAPYADVTALTTWTKFDIGGAGAAGAAYWFPWRLTEQHSTIRAVVTLATVASDLTLSARLQADDLITAVSTSNGPGIRCQGTTAQEVGMEYLWQKKSQMNNAKMRYATAHLELINPTLPAERVVAIRPMVYIDMDEYQLFRGAIGGSIRIWVKSMFIRCWNAK